MLENGRPADKEIVTHIDRCLSCLACMTTCPSGVNYMHLVDHARAHIEKTYRRPLMNRFTRGVLAAVLPYPARFRAALKLAKLGRPFAGAVRRRAGAEAVRGDAEAGARCGAGGRRRWRRRALMPAAGGKKRPRRHPHRLRPAGARARHQRGDDLAAHPPRRRGGGAARARAAAARWSITWAARKQALASARQNVDAWTREIENGGLDAIVITASGCGTTIKDYGFMLRLDPAYAEKAARVSALAKDVTEYLADARPARAGAQAGPDGRLSFRLLDAARPEDHARAEGAAGAAPASSCKEPREGHLCCGSAGTYNILQPEISARLRDRKVENIEATGADARRHRQYRLHHPDRLGGQAAGGAHGRTARLGLWRGEAGRAFWTPDCHSQVAMLAQPLIAH